jgi:hypothetical protein
MSGDLLTDKEKIVPLYVLPARETFRTIGAERTDGPASRAAPQQEAYRRWRRKRRRETAGLSSAPLANRING